MASFTQRPNPMAISSLLCDSVQADEASLIIPQKSKRPGRGRFLPSEVTGPGVSPNIRFCHNVGYWLKSIAQDTTGDFGSFETLAGAIKLPPDDAIGAIEPDENKIPIKRSLCARILIGMAVIHEHNLRGVLLNQSGETHIACRPNIAQPFKCSNLGISQAQMVLLGTDVLTASDLFKLCISSDRFPPKDRCPEHRGGTYTRLDDIEKHLPHSERQRLYIELGCWYIRQSIGPQFRFWLFECPWESPYDVRPPTLEERTPRKVDEAEIKIKKSEDDTD